jgi:uncharacterized SAM-binding protein YcdF (DUF218 family)
MLSPFFWMVLSFLLYFRLRNARWKKRALFAGVGIFLFFSNTVIFSLFCRMWEVPGTRLSEMKHHDVAIVLGGMFEYNSDVDEISIRRQGDRLIQAMNLYKSGKVDKLFISGDSGFLGDHGLHEAKQVKALLLRWGIPEEDIITEEKSKNTHENALFTVKKLRRSYPHLETFVLVTSGIHMQRALGCFEREGLHCTPYSTDLYANQNGVFYWDQYLIPNVSNFVSWNYALKELFGYIAYDMAGYI